jgi:hypothetical protein
VRLALWTPTPGAAWVSAVVPLLGSGVRVLDSAVPPASVPADAHVYHVAGRAEHGFVFRALRARRGIVLLEEWDLCALVLAETAGRGDPALLRQAARRAAGDTGALVARQLERNLAGEMLTLEAPLAEVVLDQSLAVAAVTRDVLARVQAARPDLPLAHLPLPFVTAGDGTDRAPARRALGPARALVVVLPPSGAHARERVLAAVEPLRHESTLELRVAPAGAAADALVEAADVLVALEHPSRGGLDPRVARAVGQGVPTLVTAGSTASLEMPEGVVVRVSPGESEASELRAQVARLVTDEPLRARIGMLARAWTRDLGDRRRQAGALRELVGRALEREAAAGPERGRDDGPGGRAVDELRWVARSAGLPEAPEDASALARELFTSGARSDATQGEASGGST